MCAVDEDSLDMEGALVEIDYVSQENKDSEEKALPVQSGIRVRSVA